MQKRLRAAFQWAICLWISGGLCLAWTEEAELWVPMVTDSPDQHLYFHDILQSAFKEAGHSLTIHVVRLPQLRMHHMMDTGGISLTWMIQSQERDAAYVPIAIGLTEGLIGKRILFIKAEHQALYSGVKTLDDFRALGRVGAMGESWFDVEIWKANNLPYKTRSGNWKSIFGMVERGHLYDYFSRGANEILVESKLYPNLHVEETLVLEYNRDIYFYLSKSGAHAGMAHESLLKTVLGRAKKTGMIKRMVEKYWGADLKQLNMKNRTRLLLKTPD